MKLSTRNKETVKQFKDNSPPAKGYHNSVLGFQWNNLHELFGEGKEHMSRMAKIRDLGCELVHRSSVTKHEEQAWRLEIFIQF